MGRRKLPSIPSYSSYSTTPTSYSAAPPPGASYIHSHQQVVAVPPPPHSMPPQAMSSPLAVQTDSLKRSVGVGGIVRPQTSPAPVYISSSAPIPSTSSSYSIFGVSSTCTQTATALLPSAADKLPNGHLPTAAPTDYSRPSSVASVTSSLARSIDPAIIPGASFQPTAKPKTALRQPVSVARTKPPSAHVPKIPNTLARVLLKKELKEALSRRREALEACEIEANQRQYIVHRMLVTGLLPEAREDDIPKVTSCQLPLELISGARVIRKPTHTVATQKNDVSTYRPHISMESTNIAPIPATRQFLPTTSLRAQLEVERKPRYRDLSSARTVETQTEQVSVDDYLPSSSLRSKPSTSRPSHRGRAVQTNDLLEATKKYFEDYDRQLNELTEKAKRAAQRRQFEFHDDDPLSRETRRLQLMDELARRRERMLANIDLPSETLPYRAYHSQTALDTSDYSSLVPHYGSLPRIDYPSRTKRSPLTRDFTVRQQQHQPSTSAYNYGSLPRHYERYLGRQFQPIHVDYEQSFGARPAHSMHDLHTDNIIDPRYRSQYGLDRTDPLAYSSPYLAGRSYPSDTTNLTMPPHYGMPQHDDMISRYASYLNTEFQSGLLSQSEPSRSVYVPPVQPYTPPMPSYTSLPSYTYSEPPAMGLAPSYEMPQVYSRSENNYGARPPNYPLDYGNMERQRLLRAAEMPVEETYVAPYDQQSVYYAAPPPQQQYQYQPSRSSYPSMLTSTLPTAGGFPGKLPPTARTWSGNIVPSAYDARFPREDALSRMYATVGRRTAAAAARPTGMPMMMFDYDDAPSPSFLVNGR